MEQKIRNQPNLNRLASGLVVNTNAQEIQSYRNAKRKDGRINKLEETVSEMQEDLAEIKEMLKKKKSA